METLSRLCTVYVWCSRKLPQLMSIPLDDNSPHLISMRGAIEQFNHDYGSGWTRRVFEDLRRMDENVRTVMDLLQQRKDTIYRVRTVKIRLKEAGENAKTIVNRMNSEVTTNRRMTALPSNIINILNETIQITDTVIMLRSYMRGNFEESADILAILSRRNSATQDDINRAKDASRSSLNKVIHFVSEELQGTPLEGAYTGNNRSSSGILGGKLDNLFSVGSNQRTWKSGDRNDSVTKKLSPETYLEWHDTLVKEDNSNRTDYETIKSGLNDMKQPDFMFSRGLSRFIPGPSSGDYGLTRPFDSFQNALKRFDQAMQKKAREPRFLVALRVPSGGEASPDANPGINLLRKIKDFGRAVENRDVTDVAVQPSQVNGAVKPITAALETVAKASEDIFDRYLEYLESHGIRPKLRTTGSYDRNGDSGKKSPDQTSWPAGLDADLMFGGNLKVGGYKSSAGSSSEKKAEAGAPSFMYHKFDRRLARRFSDQLMVFMERVVSSSEDVGNLIRTIRKDDKEKGVNAMLKRAMQSVERSGGDRVENVLQSAARAVEDARNIYTKLDSHLSSLLDGSRPDEQAALLRNEVNHTKRKISDKLGHNMEALASEYIQLLHDHKHVFTKFLKDIHGDAFKYMMYWNRIDQKDDPDGIVETYFEAMRIVRDLSNATIRGMRDTMDRYVRGAGRVGDTTSATIPRKGGAGEAGEGGTGSDTMTDAESAKAAELIQTSTDQPDKSKSELIILTQWKDFILDHDRREDITDALSEALRETEKVRRSVSDLFHGKIKPDIGQVLTSLSFVLVVSLKLVRLLFLYLALDYGERNLQTKYARTVYGRNMDPPHPIDMVVVAMGIEFGLNLLFFLFLYILKIMFGSALRAGNARIDDAFLKAYLVDYAVTTFILFLIAALVSDVISRKKYFRYRYEGERGIRALSTIVMSVAVPVYFIPFARLM